MGKCTRFGIAAGVAAVVFGGSMVHAATLVSSTFDTGLDGWTIADLTALPTGAAPPVAAFDVANYSSADGDPGGDIYETDPSPNDYYYSAPSKFLGNQVAAELGTINFDIKDVPPSGPSVDNTGVSPIILVGATESLYVPDRTVSSAFETLSYTLAPGNGFAVNAQGGPAATLADFTLVLGDLQAVYILGDYDNGSDTSSLDNVKFATAAVPEPAAMAMAMGSVVLPLLGRRRRRELTV